jgi:hypothetical protein
MTTSRFLLPATMVLQVVTAAVVVKHVASVLMISVDVVEVVFV